jgi:hypothetical protein
MRRIKIRKLKTQKQSIQFGSFKSSKDLFEDFKKTMKRSYHIFPFNIISLIYIIACTQLVHHMQLDLSTFSYVDVNTIRV